VRIEQARRDSRVDVVDAASRTERNARFVDFGSDFYERRVNVERRTRDLVRQLIALGHQVTLTPAA
jgi:hypothetical protein